jgi:membrane-associated protein
MLNLTDFIRTFTYLGVGAIIFAESGLLVGLVLPGDSLLFAAGLLASQGIMNLAALIVVVVIAAIAGNLTGYAIGRRFGPPLFTRSRFLTNAQLAKAEGFFARYGGGSVILGRFVPVVRTLVPLLAGISKMKLGRFSIYSVISAVLWGAGVTILGFYLGHRISNIDKYILPVIVIAILVALIPTLIHFVIQLNHQRQPRR